MSKPLRSLRLSPKSDYTRFTGVRGEIFYDPVNNTLRVFDSQTQGGVSLARADMANVTTIGFRNAAVSSNISTVLYTVTVAGPLAPDTGNKYRLNGVYRPELNFVIGYTYVFDQSNLTNVYFPNANGTTLNPHPLNFSADNLSGELLGGTSYTTNVQYLLDGLAVTKAQYNSSAFNTATTRQVRITVTNATPSILYYWCWNHPEMGRSISVAEPGTGGNAFGYVNTSNSPGTLYANIPEDQLSLVAGEHMEITLDEELRTVNFTVDLPSSYSDLTGLAFESGVAISEFSNDLTFADDSNSAVPTEAAVRGYIDRRLGYNHNGSAIAGGSLIGNAPYATEQYADSLLGSLTVVGTTIDTLDSSAITIQTSVQFDSDVSIGNDLIFRDGTRQTTSAVGIPGPTGPQGPQGASGSGSGDVLSAGGGYVDNRIVRYDGVTGTIIQVSSASISDTGLLTATSFSGDGSLITTLNATELTSGTIPNARFPATLPAVSGANLTALPATLPASSGVNLTALNATELTSGTVPDARFPATLPTVSGVNLTALNATQLTSGTVPIARIGATGTPSGSTYLRGDNSWATVSGGAASDSFATISVAGQSNVVADSATDTLTLVAGSNITITTDAGTDTITIAAAGGGSASNSFATIAVAGQSNVVADSSTDTLTLTAGTGISITTDAGTDTVTITNSVSAGATAFTGLSDRSDLTVDQFYLPAITRLNVTANGISAYRFDQYSTTDNPTIYAISGTTIAFNLAGSSSHPFLIRFAGANYDTGLTHVTTSGVVTTGSAAQGKQSGTLYWKLPAGISGTYGYLCQSHGGMNGTITVKDISAI
jgi:plastocyanin